MSHGAARRILHVFGCMNRGGAEMRTLDVMRHIDRARFQLEFCALSGKEGMLDEEIRSLGGAVHLCPLGPLFPWRFIRLLHTGHFNVVHSHVHLASGWMLRLAAASGVPVRIAHFRSTAAGKPDGLLRSVQNALMRRWIDGCATHILGVGDAALTHGWRADWWKDDRCAVIHNGLDCDPFDRPRDRAGVRREFGFPEDCTLLIHVGRMTPEKNHPRLIDIAAEAMREDPSVCLLLVGREDVRLRSELGQRLGQHGLEGRVCFAGVRSDVPRLLLAADLMVFPSLREGLPGAVLEACAAGLPVLASDLPGVWEIAARFPLVRRMSVESPDAVWAAAVRRMIAIGQRRDGAVERVRRSEYDIKTCAAAHVAAWSGMPPSELLAGSPRYGRAAGEGSRLKPVASALGWGEWHG